MRVAVSLVYTFLPANFRYIGDIETRKSVLTWTLGSEVKHQQVGNTWTEGGDIVSLSMDGNLNIFDKRVGDKPARVLYVSLLSQSCI